MGPMSEGYKSSNAVRHGKCREKERCTGPGCKVSTGKTQSKRKS